MSIALRQAYSIYPGSSQAGVAVVAGDLIIACASTYNGGIVTPECTDNAGGGSNVYSKITGTEIADVAKGYGYIFYAIAKASETLTISVSNLSSLDPGVSVHVAPGANQALSSVLDTSNTSQGTPSAGSISSASITTNHADDYIIVYWYEQMESITATENGTSFVKQTEKSDHYHSSFDRIVSGTGTYHNSISVSSSYGFGNIIAAFKAADAIVNIPVIQNQCRQRRN